MITNGSQNRLANISALYQQLDAESSIFKMSIYLTALDPDNTMPSNHDGVDMHKSFEISYANYQDVIDHEFRFSLKTLADKSYIISAIVNPMMSEKVQKDLLDFGKLISNASWDAKLYMKLIRTPFEQFDLLNLFITNNIQPQLINLGVQCSKEIKSKRQNFEPMDFFEYNNDQLKALNNLPYCWHTDDPIPAYESRIVNLGNQADWAQAKTIIRSIFQNALQNTIDEIDEVNVDRNSLCLYLDLPWLMEIIGSYHSPLTKDALAEIPNLKLTMKKLSEKYLR